MRTNSNQFKEEVPLPSNYGAAELIIYIRNNTVKSFALAIFMLGVAFAIVFLYLKVEFNSELVKESFAYIPTAILNMAKEIKLPDNEALIIDKSKYDGDLSGGAKGVNKADPSATGNKAEVPSDQASFGASNGNGSGDQGANGGGSQSKAREKVLFSLSPSSVIKQEVTNVYYDPDKVVPVDKEPYVDYEKLRRCMEYPKDAINADLTGSVIVKVLIDEFGNPMLIKFAYSHDAILAKAVQDAVKKYGKFEPARQNNKPIKFWLTIPVHFMLIEK